MASWTRMALVGAVLLCSPAALASTIPLTIDIPRGALFISGGPLVSVTGRPWGTAVGTGAEFSVHGFTRTKEPLGFGVFGQWQSVNGDHDRFCGGAQATHGVLGMELGMAHEFASDDAMATTSLHLAPFVSLGMMTASLRVGIPVSWAEGDRRHHGADVGLVLAFKLPLRVNGTPL